MVSAWLILRFLVAGLAVLGGLILWFRPPAWAVTDQGWPHRMLALGHDDRHAVAGFLFVGGSLMFYGLHDTLMIGCVIVCVGIIVWLMPPPTY